MTTPNHQSAFPKQLLDSIRTHLEEEKQKLVTRIKELRAQDPFSDPERANDNAASDGDANEESSHDRFAAMVEEQTAQLSSVESALGRIADGSYGFCVHCHQMIDTDRLAILPAATLCLSCEQKKASGK